MIKPEEIMAIIDTREQKPYDLAPLSSRRGTLKTGDYSLVGLEDRVCVERKSLEDYLGVIGRGRERFERQIERMLEFETKIIVIEASWTMLAGGYWRSKIHPSAVMGSTLGWFARGIPILMAGSREAAQLAVTRYLYVVARRQKNVEASRV